MILLGHRFKGLRDFMGAVHQGKLSCLVVIDTVVIKILILVYHVIF